MVMFPCNIKRIRSENIRERLGGKKIGHSAKKQLKNFGKEMLSKIVLHTNKQTNK